MIRGFNNKYGWLSNFWPSEIEFEGLKYPTVEHAYQAAKSEDDEVRKFVRDQITPGMAKNRGRRILLREDWDDVKVPIMRTLLRKKFYDETLRGFLIMTGNQELIEENYWHDQFWGNCICNKHRDIPGENWLGKLLMEQRTAIKEAIDDGVVF